MDVLPPILKDTYVIDLNIFTHILRVTYIIDLDKFTCILILESRTHSYGQI